MKTQRTILVTFAGRRDRMDILTRYASAAIERGLIDEWHVWEFARNPDDQAWLREKFPVTQVTPNNSFEYFRSPRPLSLRGAKVSRSLAVRARNDVHIGLRRLSGFGASYEIVLGGWSNMASCIRKFEDTNALVNVALRDPRQEPVLVQNSPGLLPEFGFSEVEIEVGPDGLKVSVGGRLLMHEAGEVPPGDFEILYRTGYGANGDWRFPEFDDHPARLFVCGPEPYFPKDALFYNRAYQYYNANYDAYRDDVFLKCDDDIVYFDIDRLAEFIAFRKEHEEFFLVSANVVNNGVCAYFQQALGLLPETSLQFELPPGGLCGTLWAEGHKAEALHDLFLRWPEAFEPEQGSAIVWNERISINFVSFLGRDLIHIPDVSGDDEHDLCYGVRKRARKQNCIWTKFRAAHLSFWKQDADMKIRDVIDGYDLLAERLLGGASQEPGKLAVG